MKIFVGTSGWMYKDWGKSFYPKELKGNELAYFSEHFKTVEINSSFYRMPSANTFSAWRKNSSDRFLFAVKLNRFITHRKRLIKDAESRYYLRLFLKNAQELRKKLAVILIQLPPSFKAKIERLDEFLSFYSSIINKLKFKPLSAIEFRHESWFSGEVYEILKKYGVGFVISSTPEYRRKIFTSSFGYIRMHGGEKHDSNYLNKDLEKLASEVRKFPPEVKKVFIYFNNDYSAHAVDNAMYLKKLLESKNK